MRALIGPLEEQRAEPQCSLIRCSTIMGLSLTGQVLIRMLPSLFVALTGREARKWPRQPFRNGPIMRSVGTFAVTLLLPLLLDCSRAVAAEPEPVLPYIPTGGENVRPLFLSNSNLAQFQDFLIAPLSNLVERGMFTARLTRAVEQNWSFSPLWNQASRENERNFTIDPQGEIVRNGAEGGPALAYIGFPFGLGRSLSEEPDPKKKGQKLLWNVASIPGIESQALFGVELLWFGRKTITRQASGLYLRQYLQGKIIPQPEDPGNDPLSLPKFGKPIDWREILQIVSPPVVFGYTNLTYRYRGALEDDFWIFSPVLGRSRKALESNRGDLIIEGELSLDDLFLFSGRPASYNAAIVGEKTVLAPFPQREALRLELEPIHESEETTTPSSLLTARGPYRNRKGQNVSVLWNADSGIFIGAPGWLPTTIQLIPRKLWVLEINPKDPFSTHGTELLFVDQESMLPFYKVVYDQKGLFNRFIMCAWNLVSGADERNRFPVPAFILGIDRKGEHAQAFEVQYVRKLSAESELTKKMELLFDIREHDKRAPKKEPAAGGPVAESEADQPSVD